MAVLTTMDGGDGEQVRYGRIEAYRALDRLRDKVRICHQAGRVSRRDGAKYPSLALLDRVLVPVRVPGGGSFHPKVWLVRQLNKAGEDRFVLVVSSRNVTTSTDWDLGVTVYGTTSGEGVSLPRIRAFAEHAMALAGEPDRIVTLGNLDSVRWALPPHATELAFDFQAGHGGPRELHPEWIKFAARPSRALLLSPFIDERMVAEAAARWRQVPKRRLVAGTEGLLTIAVGPKRDALRALEPRQIVAASETQDPPEVENGEEREDEVEQTRPLHAKVIALDDGRHAAIVIGSNNLTSSGWCGGSTEAFIRLAGDAMLCDPLWDWAGQAELFDFPDAGTAPPQQPMLERLKDELHAIRFRLEDVAGGAPSRLTMDPPSLHLPDGVWMAVSRYTTPTETIPFPTGASTVDLPSCANAMRTRFVVCKLRNHDGEETAWIASADVDPPLGDDRDRELVARLLGLREFLAYLQSLHSAEVIPGTGEGDPGDDPGNDPSQQHQSLVDSVNLEGLLHALVADPQAFAEMDRTVMRYADLIGKGQLTPDELALYVRFRDAWDAIREAFR
jgi:hypothetical protein